MVKSTAPPVTVGSSVFRPVAGSLILGVVYSAHILLLQVVPLRDWRVKLPDSVMVNVTSADGLALREVGESDATTGARVGVMVRGGAGEAEVRVGDHQ